MKSAKITLGDQIKAIREAKGLNQSNVATTVGVSPKALSQIETNKVMPRKSTLRALEKALGEKPGTFDLYIDTGAALAKPPDSVLKRLINDEPGDVSALEMIPVLERFLNEAPGVRAYVLAVLYGDSAIRRLDVSAGKVNSR